MTEWKDYTQCPECEKQCQNGSHCIGGMGGKDTKCPGFIRYVPKIRVEKQVWESTLNRSMVLEAENTQIKELLKECKSYVNSRFIETRERLNKPYMATDKVLHKKAEKLLTKIDEVLR